MPNLFAQTGGARPGKSFFDLSYSKKFTGDCGKLYPVVHDVMYPNSTWDFAFELFIRANPLATPMMADVKASIHLFFVPIRQLEPDDWEDFISGGEDGLASNTLDDWSPSDVTEGSLWELMGMPVDITPDADNRPLDLPKKAYNHVWNTYYRDEHLTSEVNIDTSEAILHRAWRKDYFTSCRPNQQLGGTPSMAITISGDGGDITIYNATDTTERNLYTYTGAASADRIGLGTNPSGNDKARWGDPGLSATSVDMATLRWNLAIQRWMERNMRAGVRHNEFLRAHYGIAPVDLTLQRPHFIGGISVPIVVSEVLGTNQDNPTDAHGQLAGHGITIDRQRVGRYTAREFGIVIGLLSIMPEAEYEQGINRQWLAKTKYDWYFPEWANVSEQAVLRREIYLNNTKADNETVFGFQGAWDHLRYKPNIICGGMRDGKGFDTWCMSRHFAAPPTLVTSFVEAQTVRDDAWAAPGEDQWIISVGNRITALQPLPRMSRPSILGYGG